MRRRRELEAIWRAGVEACLPWQVLPPFLPDPPRGRTFILAIGKASREMARIVERDWPGPIRGLAVHPHGEGPALDRIDAMGAGHPVPDEASVAAARSLLGLAEQANEDDLVLVLLSGGASSLACLPGEGLYLEDKQALTAALLRCGAPIEDINLIRRHLSRLKGGRLARAAGPARLVTLAISDVAGDSPHDIGSGPTVADPTTIEEARTALVRHGIECPRRGWSESVKQVEGEFRVVASGLDATAAAAAKAEALGYRPIVEDASGEAREAGREHAELALRLSGPSALISGGELTVRVTGRGKGGPNQEYALATAIAIAGHGGMEGLAADTDGLDGVSGAAGAYFDGTSIERGRDGKAALAANDSGAYFEALGDAFTTGPTGTNVSDLRIILKD